MTSLFCCHLLSSPPTVFLLHVGALRALRCGLACGTWRDGMDGSSRCFMWSSKRVDIRCLQALSEWSECSSGLGPVPISIVGSARIRRCSTKRIFAFPGRLCMRTPKCSAQTIFSMVDFSEIFQRIWLIWVPISVFRGWSFSQQMGTWWNRRNGTLPRDLYGLFFPADDLVFPGAGSLRTICITEWFSFFSRIWLARQRMQKGR